MSAVKVMVMEITKEMEKTIKERLTHGDNTMDGVLTVGDLKEHSTFSMDTDETVSTESVNGKQKNMQLKSVCSHNSLLLHHCRKWKVLDIKKQINNIN